MRLQSLRAAASAVRRQPQLVLAFYLVGLIPALLLLSVLAGDLGSALDRSLEGDRLLAGEGLSVWLGVAAADEVDTGLLGRLIPLRWLLTALLGILAAAGAVEVLLGRWPRGRRAAFLAGVGHHGPRFVRSAVWFAASLVPLVLLFGGAGAIGRTIASATHDDRWWLAAQLGGLVVALLAYGWLDLGYDLSRLAAARHDDRRTLKGYFRALGAVLRRPLVMLFLWWPLFLVTVAPTALYLLLRSRWAVDTGIEVALLFVVQQLVFLIHAAAKVGLWGGEVAWYEAHGAPRWCASRLDLQSRP